jgi:CMP-N,N'-diacetyllegionaminic acid synthase
MKILALIPARGGSKRVPNKNILALNGKPLINWTIDAALGITEIVDVLVSTDSEVIAEIARSAGAMVPWLRPSHLATDTATSVAVCIHALDWYEKEKGHVDGLILLQPTSPFRRIESIQRGIKLFSEDFHRSVVSFSPARSHPMWCYSLLDGSIKPFLVSKEEQMRSQDLLPAYVINGLIYIASPKYLRINKSFVGQDTRPMIIDDLIECIDVDTEQDFDLAIRVSK